MKFLLFFYAAHGLAAKAYAAPIRHRRHGVLLREVEAWQQHPELEPCDALILMLDDKDEVPGEIIKTFGDAFEGLQIKQVRPGDEPWEPTEDELLAMNPLNKLRERAALLGIEVLDEYTEDHLAGLIAAAEDEAKRIADAEEAEAQRIAAEAEEARKARETGGAGAGAGGGAGSGSGSGGNGPADEGAAAALVELAGVDHTSADALREFAKSHSVPVSPNKNTKPEKLLAAIRAKLGG